MRLALRPFLYFFCLFLLSRTADFGSGFAQGKNPSGAPSSAAASGSSEFPSQDEPGLPLPDQAGGSFDGDLSPSGSDQFGGEDGEQIRPAQSPGVPPPANSPLSPLPTPVPPARSLPSSQQRPQKKMPSPLGRPGTQQRPLPQSVGPQSPRVQPLKKAAPKILRMRAVAGKCELFLNQTSPMGTVWTLQRKLKTAKSFPSGIVSSAEKNGVWLSVTLPTGLRCSQLVGANAVVSTDQVASGAAPFLRLGLFSGMGLSELQGFHKLLPEEKFPTLRSAMGGLTFEMWPFRLMANPKKQLSQLGIFVDARYAKVIGEIAFADGSTSLPSSLSVDGGIFYAPALGTAAEFVIFLSPFRSQSWNFKLGQKGSYGEHLARSFSIQGSHVATKISWRPKAAFAVELKGGLGLFLNGTTDEVTEAQAIQLEQTQKKQTNNKFVTRAEDVVSSPDLKKISSFECGLGLKGLFGGLELSLGYQFEMQSASVARRLSSDTPLKAITQEVLIGAAYQFRKE